MRFRSRPGTELTRGARHERNVVVSEPVADAVEFWIARERPQGRDEYGRNPLFTTNHGRASGSTIQSWAYLASQPGLHIECPHNRRRAFCRYTERARASKCLSSRSSHAIRTGSITWQLTNGLSYEKVASRVAAEPSTIRQYYDKPDHDEEVKRRLPETEDLNIATSPGWTYPWWRVLTQNQGPPRGYRNPASRSPSVPTDSAASEASGCEVSRGI